MVTSTSSMPGPTGRVRGEEHPQRAPQPKLAVLVGEPIGGHTSPHLQTPGSNSTARLPAATSGSIWTSIEAIITAHDGVPPSWWRMATWFGSSIQRNGYIQH